MKTRYLAGALGLAILATPFSSEAEAIEDGSGAYVFTAPGVLTALEFVTLETGGGFQWVTEPGLSLGLDGSWMSFPQCFPCGFMMGSVDVAYHFRSPSRRLSPFVLGGVGGAFTFEEFVPAASLGGGFHYRLDHGRSVRFEVRNRIFDEGIVSLGVRLGIAF
jgi:hypothetical protein